MKPAGEWKIVVIDDEEDIRDVLAITLKDAGYHVLVAPDGPQGLALCEQESPQIVVTDIRMPGMDGLQVLEILKKKSPQIEVVVATAFGEIDLAIRALQLDASDFITKPINTEALHLALERAQNRYTTRKKLADYTALLEKENIAAHQEIADQARILHQDKMMSLGRLAASVVHELNNPLSGMLNYLHMMLKSVRSGPLSAEAQAKLERRLELVESETARCSQIISSLLTFARKSEPTFGEVRITELLERSILLSRHKLELSNIALESSLDGNLPPIKGDFNQLQQCMINLILNAVDAMPQGGLLKLDASHDPASQSVIIRVQDSGPGISPEHLPHIFEPFFTTKKEGYGVGLGLSTVYGIITHHKGTIDVESKPGHGTTFLIRLPTASIGDN